MYKFFLFIFCISNVFSQELEDAFLNRINLNFFLEDYQSALKEAKKAVKSFPASQLIQKNYVLALAKAGNDIEAIASMGAFFPVEEIAKDVSFLENLAWSILKKGLDSTQYSTRLSSMVGMYYTRDAKSVAVLKKMMRDSNAILRSIAIQLACHFRDEPLKEEIGRLLEEEKLWFVRLELLKAVGIMKIKEKATDLEKILKSARVTFEEKAIATQSLVYMYDSIDVSELKILLNSPWANLRVFGLKVAAYFEIKEIKDEILKLLKDPVSDVRIEALNSLMLFYKNIIPIQTVASFLQELYDDPNPFVAMTAATLGLFIDKGKAEKKLYKWAFDKYPENRRFAASAIAYCGEKALHLAKVLINKSDDEFVRVNLALALIGQRQSLKKSADVLFNFIIEKKTMWMWDNSINDLFTRVSPSQIKHTDQFPNYPEAIDQCLQIKLLSMLAAIDDPRALDGIKSFLKKRTLGITGLAAMTLLQEGDRESLGVLHSLLKEEDKNIRVQAALALAAMGRDKSALPILEEAYNDAFFEMKLNIVSAIGNIGDASSFKFLLKVLEEPFYMLKIAAASSIIQIANL